MTDTNNLQSEINTLLTPSGGVAASETPQQAQVVPVEQIQVTQPNVINDVRPAVDAPQFSPIVPQIQSQPNSYSTTIQETANKQFNSFLLIGGVCLVAGIVVLFVFRKTIFGPLTYSDCLEIETSTKVLLEPKYCVTPEGEIFFENKKDAPPENLGPEATMDPNNPPETILPGV